MNEYNIYRLYDYTFYNAFSDEELVEMSRSGDRFVEECLYWRYFYIIKKIISPFYILGGDREDLLQEGMLGLYHAIRDYSYDKNCTFKSYASVCIKRRIISAIRSYNRHKHNPLNNYVSFNVLLNDNYNVGILDTILPGTVLDPEAVMLNNEEKEMIGSAIKDYLSNFEQQVVNCYMSGLSYRNISSVLCCDEKAIDNALQRVRKKLKSIMVTY